MKKIYPLLLVLFFLTVNNAFGQINEKPKNRYWIDADLGVFGSKDVGGFSCDFGLNMYHNDFIYKGLVSLHREFVLFGPSPDEKYYGGGFLIGKELSSKYSHLQFLVGLGGLSGTIRGKKIESVGWSDKYETDKILVPTIPLEFNILLKPIDGFGLGFTLWGNANTKRPMFGFAVKFAIGELR